MRRENVDTAAGAEVNLKENNNNKFKVPYLRQLAEINFSKHR